MAKDFNQNNARVINSDDLKVGTLQANDSKIYYPNNYGLDAFGMVKIDLPDYAIAFIEGSNSISEFYIPASVSSIRSYAFSGFPNLNDITILNETSEITINANAFNGTKIGNKESGSKIWVVETYYDYYVADYGEYYNFGSFESDYWYTFNTTTTPQTTLTKSIVNALNIPNTKQGLVFPTHYTRFSSITIEDLTQIEKVWLKGCNNLIFELSELPNGWIYENGKLYVSPIDYDDFIDFHSGYESYVEIGWTLTVSDNTQDHKLTSDIVNNAIDNLEINEEPATIVNKIIFANTFSFATGFNLSSLYSLLDSNVGNYDTLEFPFVLDNRFYPVINNKLKHLIINATGYYNNNYVWWSWTNVFPNLEVLEFSNATRVYFARGSVSNNAPLKLIGNNLTWFGGTEYAFGFKTNAEDVLLPNLTSYNDNTSGIGYKDNQRLFVPKLTTIEKLTTNYLKKMFIGTDNCSLSSAPSFTGLIYFKANKLLEYKTKNNFSSIEDKLVGIIDGAETYNDKGFTYPKLSATLTIDSNGHLIDNGINLFSGYTATWYSDEDCTITIQPSDITSDMTVYVKLTAI